MNWNVKKNLKKNNEEKKKQITIPVSVICEEGNSEFPFSISFC
jgi:hypothetical protein